MKTTNYKDTLILAADDCKADSGIIPPKPGTVAALQYELISQQPYELTSDDVLFEVFAVRQDIDDDERSDARTALFSKPQACLRCSPLVKTYGWGIHHDEHEKVGLVSVASQLYEELKFRSSIETVKGMRSSR